MGTNNYVLITIRIYINVTAIFFLIMQFMSFLFSSLTRSSTETASEKIFHEVVFIPLICSWFIVLVFLLLYNSAYIRSIRNKALNIAFLMIAIFAACIHINQLFVTHDFILTSIVLLFIDAYVVYLACRSFHKDCA